MKYQTKPTQVDAWQWTGTLFREWLLFCRRVGIPEMPMGSTAGRDGIIRDGGIIETPTGDEIVSRGDFVIRHKDMTLSVMSAEAFEAAYEPIVEGGQ